ncbi:MAG: hypothetical protein HKN45_00065, partial [Flavobacteriales bacterium]|nr:hypothetical protein [Flavobacteriales bacterium]
DEMCATLGGRAAEEIVFGKISTGALSDLEKVTKQAYAMVTMYGLDDKLGNISYYDSSGQSDYTFSKPYSEKTAELIDQEVSELIETAYERAKKILSENKDKLTELAHQLVKEEVIFKEDLEKIFGMKAEVNNEASILHIANDKKKVEEKKPETSPVSSADLESEENKDAPSEESPNDDNEEPAINAG